jgi:hypothetical protein
MIAPFDVALRSRARGRSAGAIEQHGKPYTVRCGPGLTAPRRGWAMTRGARERWINIMARRGD